MNWLFSSILIFFILSLSPTLLNAKEKGEHDTIIHHNIKVVLYPNEHRFTAKDTITIPEQFPFVFHFFLHSGLNPVSTTQDVIISRGAAKKENASVDFFTVKLPYSVKTFEIKYNGVIHYPIEQDGKKETRGMKQTPGIISDEGVYLENESYWYPVFDNGLVTFNFQIELPFEWDALFYTARLKGHSSAIHYKLILSSRNTSQLVGKWRVC